MLIFVVCWTLTTHGKYSASRDEPHYLMVSQSVWADGDLDLRNNYANDDGRLFGAAGLRMGEHATTSRTGALLPSHDIGVLQVLTPVYAVATALSKLPSESILGRFRMTRGLFAYSLISLCVIGVVVAAGAVTREVLVAQGTAPAAPRLSCSSCGCRRRCCRTASWSSPSRSPSWRRRWPFSSPSAARPVPFTSG